jgi:hypothetical protein
MLSSSSYYCLIDKIAEADLISYRMELYYLFCVDTTLIAYNEHKTEELLFPSLVSTQSSDHELF